MAKLIFEIWQDVDDHSFALSGVTERGDQLRKFVSPNARLVHTFVARSDFDASQQNYDWHGWGKWKPEADWVERFYTDEEADEQRRYLIVRDRS